MNVEKLDMMEYFKEAEKSGREQTKKEIATNMYKKQMKINEICEMVEIEEEKVNEWISGNNSKSKYEIMIQETEKEIEELKKDSYMEKIYSDTIADLISKIDYSRFEKEKGENEVKKTIIFNMYKKNMSFDDISQIVGINKDTVQRIASIEEKIRSKV